MVNKQPAVVGTYVARVQAEFARNFVDGFAAAAASSSIPSTCRPVKYSNTSINTVLTFIPIHQPHRYIHLIIYKDRINLGV